MRLLATACLALLLLVGCNAGGKSSRPLSKSATLEVHYVSVENIPGSQETTDPSTGDPVFLTMPAIITAADVASVRQMDAQSPNSSLVVNLTEDGAKKLAAATAKHDDLRLALIVNGTCAAVPKVVATVSGPFAVTLSPKKCEAVYTSLTGE
jgi:preprotein translocase subunit SecD